MAFASAGGGRVTFDLVQFYRNESRLIDVDTLELPDAVLAATLDELQSSFESGAIRPAAAKSYPLSHAQEAYEAVGRDRDVRHVLVTAHRG